LRYELIGNNDTSNIIQTVLQNRGIEDTDTYLNLTQHQTYDYNDLDNIQTAVQCFLQHYEQKNKIVVMPDEDCDGYTSSAMLYLYIKALDPSYPVEYVMHSRPKMHGLSNEEYLKIPQDTKLFIMADGGTNDAFEFNELIKQGIDCIILDHHDSNYQDESEESVSQSAENNHAIIVNNQLSPNYPNKELSGAGIVYRFLQAVDNELWEDCADTFLDLCAVGNIADLMNVKNFETRYYINQGIENFNNKFLLALAKAQDYSMGGVINIHNVSWYLSPVINSVTRIGSMEERELLFRAMIEQDETFVYDKRGHGLVEENIYDRAARIAKNAKSRQDKQRDKVYDELKDLVDPNDKIVFLESKLAKSGLVGLSAMKIADDAKRPVIIVKEIEKNGEKILAGSCRNFDGSPIGDLKKLILLSNQFEFCSGHGNAAGLAIKEENVDAAIEWFNNYLQTVDFNTPIPCDFVLDINELSPGFIFEIDKYKWLWGTGLKEPKIAVENISVCRKDMRVQGKNFNSVSFVVDDIKFVQFNMSEDNALLEWVSAWDGEDDDVMNLNVVGEVSINSYQGTYTPQVIIKDFQITDTIQN
jgi:single-stranded-DNA-specific exonuclease